MGRASDANQDDRTLSRPESRGPERSRDALALFCIVETAEDQASVRSLETSPMAFSRVPLEKGGSEDQPRKMPHGRRVNPSANRCPTARPRGLLKGPGKLAAVYGRAG
ncbi:hypothetical protein CB1_001951015 [Camelus ferus]|nr:hypothetical protein CB1_001951015 [Camelus ferus]